MPGVQASVRTRSSAQEIYRYNRAIAQGDGRCKESQVELRGRLTAAEIGSADPDKDGTLSKAEYLKVVEDRFKAVDPDNDGTLDEKELRSGAGQKLLRLLI
jgi:hypothetical protein